MKFLSWFFGILTAVIVGVYVMAFTSVGNSMLKPIVESKINESTGLDAKLEKFSLGLGDISVVLKLDADNTVYAEGIYSLLSKSFDIAYKAELNNLENLRELAKAQISGRFHTKGTIKGDIAFMKIDGKSDVASSSTTYNVELTEFSPTSIIAKVNKADLAELLSIAGQKSYADADIDLNMNFKDIKPHQLDGDITLTTTKGKLNTKVMKNDFNITIPKTDFAMNLYAKLAGDDVDYKYLLKSNLAKISSSGKLSPQPLNLDIKYGIDIKELAVLKPMSGADLRGALKLSGTAKGGREELSVNALSDIASSKTNLEVILKEFAPASIKGKIKGLKLEKLLYMAKQPHFADGVLDADIDIADARAGKLKGSVVTNVYNALLDSKVMTKEFEFKHEMPKTSFSSKTVTKLNGNLSDTNVNIDSSIADLDIKSAKFKISDASFVSDYTAKIANLDKLYFVTGQHMRGSVKVEGELKKTKDLDFSAHTKIAGGKIDAKLHNDDFQAKLDDVQTLELLHMLIYPEIFKSSLKADVNYNLATQKGKFEGHVIDGKFTSNQAFDLARQYAKIDMYKETFKGDVNADINKEKILASIDLVGRTSYIKTKDAKLNTKKETIEATIDINANNNPLVVKLSGKTTSPKVEVDAGKLMQKAIEKKVQEKLKDKLGDDVGNILKGFF